MTFLEQSRSPRALRDAVTLAVATLGLGLNLRASILLGPHLHERFDVRPGRYVLLVALPVLAAAFVRLPVGVLTDRFGARAMFSAVSLVGAAAVVGLGLADRLPAAVVAGTAAGVGSAAFVVGAALVARTFSYGRRGRALGVFGAGAAIAGALSAISRGFDANGRQASFVLGGLLVAFAGMSALVLRDPVPAGRVRSPVRQSMETLRAASATSVSLLYVLALGGMVSIAVFLPICLATVYRVEWLHALAVTGMVVLMAAAARLAAGWWTDRHPTARLLLACYGVAAVLCVGAALAPRFGWLAMPLIAGIAVCDGLASGALLALIGKAARADSAGAVMGVTGAAGALGALLPPVLFAGVHALTHSYSAAWGLLAAVLLAAALYVRTHGLSIGLGLAVKFEPEPSPTRMTVAVVGESGTRSGAAAVVSRLAELAASDELVVVYGSDDRARPGLHPAAFAAGLRDRLPRHSVVVVRIARETDGLGNDALLLSEYVEAGTLAIAVVPSEADPRSVAAELSIYLQADRVLMVSFTTGKGVELQPV